jgi:hypothetical protein
VSTSPTTSGPDSVFDKPGSAWADGLAVFGGCALLTLGVFQFVQGLSAALEDEVYLRTPNYVFDFDLTAWGWIHMIIGVIAVVVGGAIVAGQWWGFSAGIGIAILSALASFAFMPYYPLWALVIIAFDIAVIWALSSLLGRRRVP